eukprot:5789746-Prymnesium_polylepis.1
MAAAAPTSGVAGAAARRLFLIGVLHLQAPCVVATRDCRGEEHDLPTGLFESTRTHEASVAMLLCPSIPAGCCTFRVGA